MSFTNSNAMKEARGHQTSAQGATRGWTRVDTVREQ